ncbi:MAG TPA: amidohydrolase [Candidatus Onthovivens sp.]|nr:amidohydrolase [Candidatus Onthovivens sp.]
MKILFKNPLILTMKDGPILMKKDLLVVDNIIARIEDNISIDGVDEIIDAANTVLMPSFKNAHTHSAMTFSRSSSDDLSLADWLNNCIFPMEEHLERGDVYHLSKGSFLEYLTSGVSACFDMYYSPLEIARAALDFNFRVVILGTPTSGRQSIEELVETYKEINGYNDDLVSFQFGFHAEYTLSDDKLKGLKVLVKEFKAPISTHSSETPFEVEGCKKRRNGLTPVEFLNENGLIDYGGTIFHGVALNDNDIEILKKKNISVVSCPGSNGKLASGIAPITKLVNRGINVALGTDGAGSNNSLDMFKEMTLLYNFQKINDKTPLTTSAYEILKMATVNGSKAMGLKNTDTIEVNKYADLILIDLDRPNMQPLNNIIANIVYSGSKDNIKLTMINGKIMYYNRQFYLNEDYHEIYAKQQEISDRLNKTNPYNKK